MSGRAGRSGWSQEGIVYLFADSKLSFDAVKDWVDKLRFSTLSEMPSRLLPGVFEPLK
jgi:superfamily II helicase